MYSKIFSGVLAVSIVLTGFFTYYSWSWLQSIGSPATAVEGYDYHDGLGWAVLCITTVVLLILANVVLWISRNAWAMWTTLIYFAVFVLLRYFWLDQAYFQFKKANGLWSGSFSIGPLLGVILVVIAAVLVFFDQYAIVRLQRRMYPPAVEVGPVTETDPTDEAK